MVKIVAIVGISVIVFLTLIIYITKPQAPTGVTQKRESTVVIVSPTEAPVAFKAAFAIFTNGTFRVFTASMYHNLSNEVYIQADNPNIIHVKKRGVTWSDFFKTLPMELTDTCLTTGTKQTFCTDSKASLRFFLNGQRTDNLLSRVIKPGDKTLITYGSESKQQLERQFQQIPDPL